MVRILTRLNRGGPLRQVTALVPGLAARGWTGPVVAGTTGRTEQDGGGALRQAGARIVTVPSLQRGLDTGRDARALRALLAILRREQPDLVHTHMGKAGALGRVAAALLKIPSVHTFHGHHFFAPWPYSALAVEAERRLGRLTSRGVVLTERQRHDVVRVHRILPAERVEVIPPGLDIDPYRRRAAAARPRELPVAWTGGGQPLFLWAGRFVEVKRPDVLVEAVARSRAAFRVVMLGDGPRRSAIREEVRARGLEGRILLPGEVTDTAPWMAAADAVVLSSASEGAPIVLLEAKALGRPAVTTSVGGVCDLVEHLGDGLWVPPDDAPALAGQLDRLALDGELRRRLGESARRGVEARFGADRLAADTAALYARVLASRPQGPTAPPRGARRRRGRYHRRR